jgi:hypothetical protein
VGRPGMQRTHAQRVQGVGSRKVKKMRIDIAYSTTEWSEDLERKDQESAPDRHNDKPIAFRDVTTWKTLLAELDKRFQEIQLRFDRVQDQLSAIEAKLKSYDEQFSSQMTPKPFATC